MATGKIKWFNVTKGYGFITPDDGGADVFLHMSKVEEAKLSTLESGMAIRYSLGSNGGKIFAQGLAIIPSQNDKKLRPKRKHADDPVSEETDVDEEFEREWGLRRS